MRRPKASARARRLLLALAGAAAAAAGGAGAVSVTVAEFLELGEAPARAAPAPAPAPAVLVNGTLAGLNLTRVWLKALGVRDYAADELGPGYAEVVAQATRSCDPADNLMRRVERLPQLATTATALRRSGLDVAASGPGPMTLLAPTDAAWAVLAAELEAGGPDAQRLLDTSIERLMLYHLHGGLLDLTSAAPGAAPWQAPTLAGPPVTVAASPSAVTVDGATVGSVQAACNGRLAVVDAVLIPPAASPVEAEPAPLPAPPAEDAQEEETVVRQDGEQLFRPAPAPAAAPCDADRECCDVPPPGSSHTCAEQADWGKCADAWMAGFCRRACGECDPEEGAEVAEADRRPGACAEDGVLVQVWDNAAKREGGKGASVGLYLSGGNKVALPAAARAAAAKGKGKATATRFCGYFCPPVTGEYRFAQTAADRATFTLHDRRGEAAALGRAAEGGGARRPPLARLEQAAPTKPQAWEKRTPAVRLQQGVPYMVEALHFAAADTSKPHFRLGVEFPNGLRARPVAAAHFTASCGAEGAAEEQEVPAAPPADPCACAADGVSGGQATGQAGCFPYDVAAYFRNSDRAAAPIREHLTADAWPAAPLRVAASDGGPDAYGRLWSAAYRAWAATGYREAPARMCYVVDPSRCPLAEPSARWPGAAWRVCEAEP